MVLSIKMSSSHTRETVSLRCSRCNKKIFYSLDNEPDLWSGTHPRIQSSPVTYTQLAEASIDFARAIKAVNPSGLIFGAANYGWQGFETLQNASDAGGRKFYPLVFGANGRSRTLGRTQTPRCA